MTADIKLLRKHCNGLNGRFFYDAERGDIAYISKVCDDRQCDCEVNLNQGGDQDCTHSLYDWEGEDHLLMPLADMLNAVPVLLSEVDRLEQEVAQWKRAASNRTLHMATGWEKDEKEWLAEVARLRALCREAVKIGKSWTGEEPFGDSERLSQIANEVGDE